MTTDGPAVVMAGLVVLSVACSAGLSTRSADRLDTSGYPPDIQAAYRVFAVRCSRCHTLARPLNARIRDERHWVRYVARMRRQPGSGINESNASEILKFLLFYTQELKREEGFGDDPGPDEGDIEGRVQEPVPAEVAPAERLEAAPATVTEEAPRPPPPLPPVEEPGDTGASAPDFSEAEPESGREQ